MAKHRVWWRSSDLRSLRTSATRFKQPAPSHHLQPSLGLFQHSAKGLSVSDSFHSRSPAEAWVRSELRAGKHTPSRLQCELVEPKGRTPGLGERGWGPESSGGRAAWERASHRTRSADTGDERPHRVTRLSWLRVRQRPGARDHAGDPAPRRVARLSP